MKTAVEFMLQNVLSSAETSNRAKFFIRKIMQEGFAELQDAPPEIIEDSFRQSTALMYWVSTGIVIENMPMPEGFWEYSADRIPALAPVRPALETGVPEHDEV